MAQASLARADRELRRRPHDLDTAQLHALVDQGLTLLAHEMHDICAPVLERLGGPDWPSRLTVELGSSPDRKLARYDLVSYYRLLNKPWRGRCDLRDAFDPERFRDSARALENLRALRNQHAHSDAVTDVASAHQALTTMLRFARLADFKAQSRLSDLLQSLGSCRPLAETNLLSERQARDLASEAEATALQAQQAEAARQSAEASAEAALDRAHAAEVARNEADRKARELNQELLSLRTALRDTDVEHDAAIRDREVRLASMQREARAQLSAAESERQQLQDELRRSRAEEDRARAHQAALEAKVDELTRRLSSAEAGTPAGGTPPIKVAEIVRNVQERVCEIVRQSLANDDDGSDEPLPDPGEAWPYERGTEVWTLALDHSMQRRSDDRDLEALVGPKRAAELIDQFLRVRPSGGRVWVDEDGDASTHVDGQLIYLGRLGDEETVAPEVALGTPLGAFSGRKYHVWRTYIKDSCGTNLSAIIDRDTAKAVRERLLRVRPKGGVYRVNAGGVAATYVDGQWVYAGTVRPSEWFPGHITG